LSVIIIYIISICPKFIARFMLSSRNKIGAKEVFEEQEMTVAEEEEEISSEVFSP